MQDIRRQIAIGIRWLPLVVVCALVAAFVAYSWSSSQPEVFEASGRLVVDTGPDPATQNVAVAEGLANRYADRARSDRVVRAVIDDLRLDESVGSIQSRLLTGVDDTGELVVEMRAGDGISAQQIALAIGAEIRARVRDELITDAVRDAEADIAATEALIRSNQRRLDTLQAKAGKSDVERGEMLALMGQLNELRRVKRDLEPSSRAGVRYLLEWTDRPSIPDDPVEPRPMYWTLLALVVGGMAAVVLAFGLEYLRHNGRVRDERDLEDSTGLLAVGTVTEDRRDLRKGAAARLVMLIYPRSDAAEAYRGMLAKIGFASGNARSLMVASAADSDAKSVVAANLALAYAEAGRNVILVDADFRSPHMHTFFGVPNDRGLTTLLADPDAPLRWVTVATSHPRLGLMPAGLPPPETADPLGAQQVARLLRRLLNAADMVVFDSPSMSDNLDAAVLATQLEESLLVVPAGANEREVADAARVLHGAESDVVGAVLYRKVRRSRRGSRKSVVPPPPSKSSQQGPPRRIPVSVTRGNAPQGAPPAASTQAPSNANGGRGQPPPMRPTNGSAPPAATKPASTAPYSVPYGTEKASPSN